MKNLKNKKGFTIVELVIVIAVIAILAAVLIPTFGSVIEKANESKALQEGRNTYMNWVAEQENVSAALTGKYYVKVGDYYVLIEDGQINEEVTKKAPSAEYVDINEDAAPQEPVVTYCDCAEGIQADTNPADGVCDVCGDSIQG